MVRSVALPVLVALVCVLVAGCQGANPMQTAGSDGWSHYGMEDKEWGPTVALGMIGGDEANVIVEGTIVDVCQKKGCWMRVADGGDELFVRFQDYGFFVPMNAAGHEVVMHGTSVAQVASVEELRHYAEDAGKSPEEIAAITEPETRVTFFADSVYIAGPGLGEPHQQ
jgi:predicted small secreted protein